MDDKTKLYVFAKKEVALIFIFMILIAITSFVFGVKIGKNYSYQTAGYTEEEKKKVEMLSAKEEAVSENLKEKTTVKGTEEKQEVFDETHKKLEEELKKLDENKAAQKTPQAENAGEHAKVEVKEAVKEPVEEKAIEPAHTAEEVARPAGESRVAKKDQYTGKFTIQLGSHKTMGEAEKFADGFRVRGYDPIINEVEVKGAVWYRVSLGVFSSVSEAKDYIIKEKSLFQGQDYVIGRFD